MTGKLRLAALALVALAAASGCVTHLEKPHLQVVDVELLKGDLLQQQLQVRMRVHNPNARELPVRGITYELQLGGESFAHGESQRDFVVPALGSAEFDMNMTANAASALLKLASSGRKMDSLEYRMVGKVALASGLLRTIPFDERGQIKLR